MSELKPCQFCRDGGKPELYFEFGYGFIGCTVCRARGPQKNNPGQAVEAWNTRTPAPEQPATEEGEIVMRGGSVVYGPGCHGINTKGPLEALQEALTKRETQAQAEPVAELRDKMRQRFESDTSPGYKKWDVCRAELDVILASPLYTQPQRLAVSIATQEMVDAAFRAACKDGAKGLSWSTTRKAIDAAVAASTEQPQRLAEQARIKELEEALQHIGMDLEMLGLNTDDVVAALGGHPIKAQRSAEQINTCDKPMDGWVCFHCGDRFTTIGSARDHFGFDQRCDPACRIKVGAERGLVMALRKAEQSAADAWSALHNESSDAVRAYEGLVSRHGDQLRVMEELGYERGLSDAALQSQRAAVHAIWWDRTKYGYSALFNAIAAATKIEGNAIGISVKTFEDTILAAAPDREG